MSGNVPARMSAPMHGVAHDQAGQRQDEPEQAPDATSVNARSRDMSGTVASSPNSTAPAQGRSTPNQRLTGRQARSV